MRKGKELEAAVEKMEAAVEKFDEAFGRIVERLRVFYWCGRSGHPLLEKPGKCPVCKKETHEGEFDPDELWWCGEEGHPRYRGSHPKVCPLCGRQLKRAKGKK